MSARQFMAVVRYLQGGPDEWTSEVLWTGDRHPTLAMAKREGFRHCESDDFNIAIVRDGTLLDWTWMGESIGEEQAELDAIAQQLGLLRAALHALNTAVPGDSEVPS